MLREEIENEYFNWMCNIVDDGNVPGKRGYRKLLTALHAREFYFILPLDGDRACDGLYLRNRFAWNNDYDELEIRDLLSDIPCSVLEMMIALAIRIEEEHMGVAIDWFWLMVLNLGLKGQRDDVFDKMLVNGSIDILLERRYEPNGIGGLFIVANKPGEDLRKVTIWYQMQWYLLENLPANFGID